MRELWKRPGTLNQISLIAVFIAYAASMVAIMVKAPLAGLIITAGSIALVAFCFWFFFHDEARSNRIRRSGQPADGDPHEASAKCLMNRFEIPAYQPGVRISLLVDPRDRRKVVVL